jgi:hypothetical protein
MFNSPHIDDFISSVDQRKTFHSPILCNRTDKLLGI